jgi:hypothetical protein
MLEYRKQYYLPVTVDGIKELDLLKTDLLKMELTTATVYTINQQTEARSDLISKIFYDNYDLAWIIHYHNDILDPFTEYYVGRDINIPYLDDYYLFYNRYAKEL